jgi:hypothetical protein
MVAQENSGAIIKRPRNCFAGQHPGKGDTGKCA